MFSYPVSYPVKGVVSSLLGSDSTLLTTSAIISTAGASLPAAWTNTKTDTTSTYRDDNGIWRPTTSGMIRYHNDPDIGTRGVLVEGSMQNKCTNYNCAPDASLTNVTKGGDAASTLTRDNSGTVSSALTAAGLATLVSNGYMFKLDNTLGVTSATATITGQCGNTNPHSLQVWAMAGASGSAGSFGLTGHAIQTTVTGTTLAWYKRQNVTPGAITDQFVITATAGKVIYFIVNQLEEGQLCTTPIIIAGSSVTRNRDAISANVSSLTGFTAAAGGLSMKVYAPFFATTQNTEGLFGIVNGTGTVNSIGIRRSGTNKTMIDGQCIDGSSVDASTNDVGGMLPDRPYPVGVLWGGSEFRTFCGLRNTKITGISTLPTGFTKIWLGRWSEFNGYAISILITELHLQSGKKPSLAQAIAPLFNGSSVAIMMMGQSNGRVYGRDETSGSNTNLGEQAIVSAMDTYWPDKDCYYMDMAVSATNLDDLPSGPSWMTTNKPVNDSSADDTGLYTDGLYLSNALEQAAAFVAAGGTILSYNWNQGENDQGGPTLGQWKTRLGYIAQRSKATSNAPFILISPANRTTGAPGYETWRNAFRQLANENDYIFRGAETYWLTMDPATTNLHVASAGTVQYAPIMATRAAKLNNKNVTSPSRGPIITAVSRVGTAVTVTIAHDQGATDFTPTTAIQGFKFYENSSEITISSAVRTDANTITLTLGTTPGGGTEKLYYGQGTMSDVTDWTKVVRDNSTYQLGLLTEEVTLPYTYTVVKDFLFKDFNSSDFNT